MDALQVRRAEATQVALRLRKQGRSLTALGVVGLGSAAVLIAPKLALLAAGSSEVLGVGLVANVALIAGSLMFLRSARQKHREATALLVSTEVKTVTNDDTRVPRLKDGDE